MTQAQCRCVLNLLHQSSACGSEILLKQLQLFVTQFAERRCTLDMQLLRQQARDNTQIMVGPLAPNLFDHSSALLGKVSAEHFL
jgi:hypothetical protein